MENGLNIPRQGVTKAGVNDVISRHGQRLESVEHSLPNHTWKLSTSYRTGGQQLVMTS
jgi:hypothetical protein